MDNCQRHGKKKSVGLGLFFCTYHIFVNTSSMDYFDKYWKNLKPDLNLKVSMFFHPVNL